MSTANAYGVYEPWETVWLLNDKDCRVGVNIAQCKNLFFYGVEIQCGGSRTGAFGFSWPPSIRSMPYFSRYACLLACKERVRQRLELEHQSARDAKMKRIIDRALNVVSYGTQKTLWEDRK